MKRHIFSLSLLVIISTTPIISAPWSGRLSSYAQSGWAKISGQKPENKPLEANISEAQDSQELVLPVVPVGQEVKKDQNAQKLLQEQDDLSKAEERVREAALLREQNRKDQEALKRQYEEQRALMADLRGSNKANQEELYKIQEENKRLKSKIRFGATKCADQVFNAFKTGDQKEIEKALSHNVCTKNKREKTDIYRELIEQSVKRDDSQALEIFSKKYIELKYAPNFGQWLWSEVKAPVMFTVGAGAASLAWSLNMYGSAQTIAMLKAAVDTVARR